MTHEQLLAASPDELEKLSDAEIEVFYEPYLSIVRPDLNAIQQHSAKRIVKAASNNSKVSEAIRKAKAAGIDLEGIL